MHGGGVAEEVVETAGEHCGGCFAAGDDERAACAHDFFAAHAALVVVAEDVAVVISLVRESVFQIFLRELEKENKGD